MNTKVTSRNSNPKKKKSKSKFEVKKMVETRRKKKSIEEKKVLF